MTLSNSFSCRMDVYVRNVRKNIAGQGRVQELGHHSDEGHILAYKDQDEEVILTEEPSVLKHLSEINDGIYTLQGMMKEGFGQIIQGISTLTQVMERIKAISVVPEAPPPMPLLGDAERRTHSTHSTRRERSRSPRRDLKRRSRSPPSRRSHHESLPSRHHAHKPHDRRN